MLPGLVWGFFLVWIHGNTQPPRTKFFLTACTAQTRTEWESEAIYLLHHTAAHPSHPPDIRESNFYNHFIEFWIHKVSVYIYYDTHIHMRMASDAIILCKQGYEWALEVTNYSICLYSCVFLCVCVSLYERVRTCSRHQSLVQMCERWYEAPPFTLKYLSFIAAKCFV